MRSLLCEKMINDKIEEFVEIKVEDNGKGIGPQLLPQLFGPFVTTKPGGTGLGLAIAKIIVNRHGGDISVDSREKIGTVVRLSACRSRNTPRRYHDRP